MKCGCKIINSPEPQFREIEFCSLHAAAEQMMNTLNTVRQYLLDAPYVEINRDNMLALINKLIGEK